MAAHSVLEACFGRVAQFQGCGTASLIYHRLSERERTGPEPVRPAEVLTRLWEVPDNPMTARDRGSYSSLLASLLSCSRLSMGDGGTGIA